MDQQTNETTTKPTSDDLNAKMNARTLGRIAFEAHAAKIGGFDYIGNRIAPWTAQPDQVKEAWEAAARAVEARVPKTSLPASGEQS